MRSASSGRGTAPAGAATYCHQGCALSDLEPYSAQRLRFFTVRSQEAPEATVPFDPIPLIRGDDMADKGHQGFASMDEERRREIASEGGHASHEKGAAHEFTSDEAAEAGRKGNQARNMAHASRESGEASATHAGGESTTHEGERVREGNQGGTSGTQNEERSTAHRQRKTR